MDGGGGGAASDGASVDEGIVGEVEAFDEVAVVVLVEVVEVEEAVCGLRRRDGASVDEVAVDEVEAFDEVVLVEVVEVVVGGAAAPGGGDGGGALRLPRGRPADGGAAKLEEDDDARDPRGLRAGVDPQGGARGDGVGEHPEARARGRPGAGGEPGRRHVRLHRAGGRQAREPRDRQRAGEVAARADDAGDRLRVRRRRRREPHAERQSAADVGRPAAALDRRRRRPPPDAAAAGGRAAGRRPPRRRAAHQGDGVQARVPRPPFAHGGDIIGITTPSGRLAFVALPAGAESRDELVVRVSDVGNDDDEPAFTGFTPGGTKRASSKKFRAVLSSRCAPTPSPS